MVRYSILVLMGAATLFANGNNVDGPPVRRTGAQIDGGTTCTACHAGNPNPDTVGSIRVQVMNYTPGQRQTIRVTVQAPESARWGFQLTARVASDPARRAGSFNIPADDANVQIRCDSDTAARGTAPPCGETVNEFAQHRPAGTRTGSNGSATWEIPWTAPATNVGEVIFYAAGNAANNGGTNAGDRIYTTTVRIQPAGPAPAPAISQGGIITAAQFGASTTVSPGNWIEIYGTNLASSQADWGGQFTGAVAPTTVNGVRVLVGGVPAAISFVSPGQINAQVPASDATGPVTLRVETPGGNSERPVTMARTSPGLFAPANFRVNDRQFVGFVRADGSVTRTVRPGESVLMFGIGFGPTNPAVMPGMITAANSPLATAMTVRFGDAPATVGFAGLPGGFVGLYQFNLTVPMGVTGDVRLNVDLGGTPIAQTLWANVQP